MRDIDRGREKVSYRDRESERRRENHGGISLPTSPFGHAAYAGYRYTKEEDFYHKSSDSTTSIKFIANAKSRNNSPKSN